MEDVIVQDDQKQRITNGVTLSNMSRIDESAFLIISVKERML